MKYIALLLAWLPAVALQAAPLDLAAYQDRQGALTVRLGGDFSDPYFALRALLTASQAGLDIAQPARSWIAWMLPRQRSDGSFERYCLTPGATWKACAEADADDALVAMWAELLYLSAPCGKMPAAWRASAARALMHLDQLQDRQRGTYRISSRHATSLLMDNIEIHAALRAIGERQRCMGQAPSAQRKAAHLVSAIERVFRPAAQGTYLVSTQTGASASFYPHHTAQVYPILFGLAKGEAARATMQAWMAEHGDTWLARRGDVYPWGLVALAAHEAGLPEPALRWLDRSAPLRHGSHWNILEESAFQALCQTYRAQALPCQALNGEPAPP